MKIFLAIFTLLLITGCNYFTYTLYIYPDKNNLDNVLEYPNYSSLDECRAGARSLSRKYPNGDYICGRGCEFKNGFYICKEKFR